MDTGSYKTMTVKTDSIVLQSLYSARIEGRQDVEIYPQVSGTLQRLCVQEGDRVKKGQTLFIIDQVPYQAALNTAEANLKLGFQVDERDYGVGAGILREIGIKNMRLMTNNPLKRAGLEGYGLRIVENVPIVIAPNPFNEKYLKTKETVMGHRLGLFKK